jgi:hypothetical protein
MVMINPTPGQPDTPNGQPIQTPLGTSGPQLPNLFGSVAGGLVGSVTGLKANTWNIIFNTAFYASLVAAGAYLLFKGLMALATEVPGATGVSSYLKDTLTGPARGGISAGRRIGTFAATDGLSGLKTLGSVTKRKVVGGSKDFFLGPVEGPVAP